MEIRGRYLHSKGQQRSELFFVFSELHRRGGAEYDKARYLPFLFPVEYLNTTLIPETTKVLNEPLDLGGSMECVGCWLYMACWVGITDRHDWWPGTTPVMHRGAPFWMNQ